MGGCDVYLPSLNQFKRMYCSMSNEPLPTKNINNPFTGQLYIITDKRVSSGGECFAILGKQYENAVFIGENTRGVINYGNVDQLLTLQNSKLRLNVATSKFAFPIKITEGIGIIPDYWLDGEDAIGAIKTLEKGRKNYEKKFKRETKSKECENQKIK